MPRQNPAIKQQLAAWYLKRVPFPSITNVTYFSDDPLVNGSVFAPELREQQIYQIRHELLAEGYPQSVKRWNWIWAKKNIGHSLGMGKTALLAYICDQINKDFGKSFFGRSANWLSLYVKVQSGSKSMDEIAVCALESLCNESHGISIERHLLARLRQQVIVQNRSGQYPTGLASIVWHRFQNDTWIKSLNIDLAMLNTDIERLLRDSHVSAHVSRAFSQGTLKEYLSILNDNPSLYPIGAKLRGRALGILLNDIANIALAANIAKITLMLDDFYTSVLAHSQAERPPFALNIRGVAIDGAYTSARSGVYNWIAVMHTVTAPKFVTAWLEAGLDTDAPLNMTSANSVVLRGLSPQQGRILLQAYLSHSSNRASGAPTNTYPFSLDALDAIAREANQGDISPNDTSIVPRGLVNRAHMVFLQALEEKPQAPIGPEFVAHVLEGVPLPTSSEDDEMETVDTEEPRLTIECPCGCHDDSKTNDVIAVLSGSNGARSIVRHYCRNCNDEVVIEAHAS